MSGAGTKVWSMLLAFGSGGFDHISEFQRTEHVELLMRQSRAWRSVLGSKAKDMRQATNSWKLWVSGRQAWLSKKHGVLTQLAQGRQHLDVLG